MHAKTVVRNSAACLAMIVVALAAGAILTGCQHHDVAIGYHGRAGRGLGPYRTYSTSGVVYRHNSYGHSGLVQYVPAGRHNPSVVRYSTGPGHHTPSVKYLPAPRRSAPTRARSLKGIPGRTSDGRRSRGRGR